MSRRMKTAAQLLATIILATQSLTSCSDYDNGFDEATIRYNQNFRELFGDIDPNQDWNLVRQLAEKNGGGMFTRENVSNSNMWAYDHEGYNYAVPGYPDELGTYHIWEGNKVVYYSSEEWAASTQEERQGRIPAGDVTDEEIEYVSKWFRTHRNPPSSAVINWHDYFVQDISADYDRTISSDGTSCDKGKRITQIPIYTEYNFTYSPDTTVNDYKRWTAASTKRTIKYGMEKLLIKKSDGGRDENWDPNYTFNDGDVNDPTSQWYNWEHIEKFNSGTGTNDYGKYEYVSQMTADDLSDRTIQLYKYSGTTDFSYHNSDAHKRFREYTIQHLVFDIKQDNSQPCPIHKPRHCTNHHYDGHYLGFDYEVYITGAEAEDPVEGQTPALIEEEEEEGDTPSTQDKLAYKPRDGFYSNWIIKISEGVDINDNKPSDYPKVKPVEQGLLVCEDLGDFDFDFNDVVLRLQHVKYTAEANAQEDDRIRITAMAAGGTLPSSIYFLNGTQKEKMEVEGSKEIHTLLNGEVPHIINAGPEYGGAGKSWITSPINTTGLNFDEKEALVSYAFDNGLIEIVVDEDEDGNNGTVITSINSGYHSDNKHGDYTEGNAPQMMLLPIDFLWPQERTFIGDAYKQFGTWVTDKKNTDWYLTPELNSVTYRYISSGAGSSSPATKPERTIKTTCDCNNNQWSESYDTSFEITVPVNTEFHITAWNETAGDDKQISHNIVRDGANVTVEQSNNNNGDYFTIKTGNTNGTARLSIIVDGYTYITVTITVTGGTEPGTGGEKEGNDYTIYGTEQTTFANPTNQSGIAAGAKLIATENFPEESTVTITLIMESQYKSAAFYGYKWLGGDQNRWDQTTINNTNFDGDVSGNPNYTMYQLTADAEELKKYEYIGCVPNGEGFTIDKIFIEIKNSAKKRTISRK